MLWDFWRSAALKKEVQDGELLHSLWETCFKDSEILPELRAAACCAACPENGRRPGSADCPEIVRIEPFCNIITNI